MTGGEKSLGGHVFFYGDERLEGILEPPGVVPPAGEEARQVLGGVVVAHPHPLYGGTMAQPLVYRMAKACRMRGMTTLRFNFRGVGKSRGRYGGSDEHRDVEAATAFLRGQLEPGAPVGLAGYSFGSVMAAMAATGSTAVEALALVALVAAWDEMSDGALEGLRAFKGPVLAVCGELDDLAPPELVKAVLSDLNLDFTLRVIPDAGHFFEGQQDEVSDQVAAFFEHAFRSARAL